MISGSLDTTIRVWDVLEGCCLHTLVGHTSLTSGMQLLDNILVSANADSTIKVYSFKLNKFSLYLLGMGYKYRPLYSYTRWT